MAPKRQQAAQAAPSLLSLPPEVLLHILASVPLEDRLSRVMLVCKQLHALCTAPALLSELDVRIHGQHSLARTQALLRFLMRHGGHVHSLQLDVVREDGEDSLDGEDGEDESEHYEVAALVSACLVASSGLRRLRISAGTPLFAASFLPLLAALEELSLPGRDSNLAAPLCGALRQLTSLQSLHLSGWLVCEGEGPALPPSLTRLCIEGDLDQADAPLDGRVLVGLPALRFLKLAEASYTAASLGALGGLTALTRLALFRMRNFPPAEALAALAPSLRVLEVHSAVEEAVLNSCVQALTGLESLALDLGFNQTEELLLQPATLALPRLRCLSLTGYNNMFGGPGSGRRPSNLPAGPYLSALQSLAMPLPLAVSAVPVLAQAQHLHTLCLQVPHAQVVIGPVSWSTFWRFVATHPPLRSLLIETFAGSHSCTVQLLDALLQLPRQRPALEVRRLTTFDDRTLHPPACWAELHAD